MTTIGESALSTSWKPPKAYVQVTVNTGSDPFDFDSIKNNPDVELWAFRIPPTLKVRHLDGFSFQLPASLPSTSNTLVGQVVRKNVPFDIRVLADSAAAEEEPQDQTATPLGEDLKALQCFLPRRKKGNKLFPAPKPIARHIVISQSVVLPTPIDPHIDVSQPPPRPQPLDRLNHQFTPTGSLGTLDSSIKPQNVMDVDPPLDGPTKIKERKRKHHPADEGPVTKSPKKAKK